MKSSSLTDKKTAKQKQMNESYATNFVSKMFPRNNFFRIKIVPQDISASGKSIRIARSDKHEIIELIICFRKEWMSGVLAPF